MEAEATKQSGEIEDSDVIIARVKRLDAIMGVDGWGDVGVKVPRAWQAAQLPNQCRDKGYSAAITREFLDLRGKIDGWKIRRQAADDAIAAFEAKVKALRT